MVKTTIELEGKYRESLALKAFDKSVSTGRGVPSVEGAQGDQDAWWTAARQTFDRSLDAERIEETLRLRQNNSGG